MDDETGLTGHQSLTSDMAAATVGAKTLRERVLDIFELAGSGGRTTREVCLNLGLSHQTISTRISELIARARILPTSQFRGPVSYQMQRVCIYRSEVTWQTVNTGLSGDYMLLLDWIRLRPQRAALLNQNGISKIDSKLAWLVARRLVQFIIISHVEHVILTGIGEEVYFGRSEVSKSGDKSALNAMVEIMRLTRTSSFADAVARVAKLEDGQKPLIDSRKG